MNSQEMVTDFSIETGSEPDSRKPIQELLDSLNKHMKKAGIDPEEYDFALNPSLMSGSRIPAKFRWLIAFAVEGNSEGYYVHVGAIMPQPKTAMLGMQEPTRLYFDFGFCKTYSAESAYAIAKEAQRFLTAVIWN